MLDDHNRERRAAGVNDVEQTLLPDQALHLRAGDAIVRVDVGVGDRPALRGREASRVRDLARDTAVFGAGVLLGALASVDGGDHRSLPSGKKYRASSAAR